MNRRQFLQNSTAAALAGPKGAHAQSSRPNIVLIYADDLGYGDLGCYGSQLPTPNIDRLASEGARFTSFCSPSSVCSPARAALLTGRYAPRTGVFGVLDPDETSGLPAREQTLPQLLKTAGYRSALIGKWHLGGKPGFLPNDRGFDYFYGLPWSNDMWPRPLMQNTDIIEQPADLDLLQVRSTGQALQFMRNPRPEPFFLFYATTAPHIPLNTSPRFRGTTGMGKYADVMAEFDWSVGELMRGVREMGQEQNTLFLLSSDNGPWFQGSAGRLRARKGESYEGGVRVPMIARMPGTIPAGTTVSGFASGLDLFPTIANWVGARPSAPVLDGVDIRPMLTGQSDSVERDVYLYFDFLNAQCARYGDWKVHFSRYNSRAFSPEPAFGRVNLPLPRPELYNLAVDPAEAYECSDANPNVVADIRKRVEEKLATMPDFVAATWRDTMALPVYDTAPGALPIQRRP